MKKNSRKTGALKKSLKENSMTLDGKNNSLEKKNHIGTEEFEEDRDINLRMKPQPLKKLGSHVNGDETING